MQFLRSKEAFTFFALFLQFPVSKNFLSLYLRSVHDLANSPNLAFPPFLCFFPFPFFPFSPFFPLTFPHCKSPLEFEINLSMFKVEGANFPFLFLHSAKRFPPVILYPC